MFLNLDEKDNSKLAIIDDQGVNLKYKEVVDFLNKRVSEVPPRSLVFALSRNNTEFLLGLLFMLNSDIVPLVLSSDINAELLEKLDVEYQPGFYFCPNEFNIEGSRINVKGLNNYTFVRTSNTITNINPKIELLLSTSGSTGSPKLVKFKKGNMEWNAQNVAKAFNWSSEERQISSLPLNYVMGLNSTLSTLSAGGTVLLTDKNIMDKDFWNFIRNNKGTNFTGVPFSYDLLLRLHIERMDLPFLKTFAQGGGKLSEKSFKNFAYLAREKNLQFYATYGATETSARCSILYPKDTLTKVQSIGKPMPDVEMILLDNNNSIVTEPFIQGELIIKGNNVTMGYARKKDDLDLPDQFNGEYKTGDIAYFDNDGYFYIVGRRVRFIKLLGNRIGLDDCEKILSDHFKEEFVCIGMDDKLLVLTTSDTESSTIIKLLSDKLKLRSSLFSVFKRLEFPRSENGKILYSKLISEYL